MLSSLSRMTTDFVSTSLDSRPTPDHRCWNPLILRERRAKVSILSLGCLLSASMLCKGMSSFMQKRIVNKFHLRIQPCFFLLQIHVLFGRAHIPGKLAQEICSMALAYTNQYNEIQCAPLIVVAPEMANERMSIRQAEYSCTKRSGNERPQG